VSDHFAAYAVDGNNRTTDLDKCAFAFYFDASTSPYTWCAWWQVNLGDFYLVKAITVYFPTASPGLYADVRIFFPNNVDLASCYAW